MQILLAEDDRVTRRMLEVRVRAWGHEPIPAEDGREALELLRAENGPQFALLDWMMPELSGIEVCRQLQPLREERFIYVIMVTAREGSEATVEALESGADDYLTKPINIAELQARLNVGIRMLELQNRLQEANRELERMASTDGLTQVANRKAIMDHLDRMVERAKASNGNGTIAVTLADIDHFKRFNDTYGHQCGDEVLVEFAQRLERACRPEDRVGRYGGEEFIVISGGVPPESAHALGQRFLQAVNGHPFETQAGALPVTASFGLVCTVCGAAAASASLTRAADALLYEAKARGRNQVVASVD